MTSATGRPPPTSDMKCPECRHDSPDSARYCSQCGAALTASFCACCGRAIPPTAEFCLTCNDAASTPASRERADPEPISSLDDADPEAIAFLEFVRERRARRRREFLVTAWLATGVVAAMSVLIVIGPERAMFWRSQAVRENVAVDRPQGPPASAETPLRAAPKTADAPGTTEEPRAAEAPGSTEEPRAAEAPRTAEQSRTTGDPSTTEQSRTTEQPRTTDQPRRTEAPRVAEETSRPTTPAPELPPRAARVTTRAIPGAPSVPQPRPALPSRERDAASRGFAVPPTQTARLPRQADPAQDVPLIVGREANVVIGDLSITVQRDAKVVNSRRVVDYRVRLTDRAGGPITDAQVLLRGEGRDGSVMEARIEPSSTAGTYEASLFLPGPGLAQLALRILRTDRTLELPMTVASGAALR